MSGVKPSRVSKSGNGLAQRIVGILESGPRKLNLLRAFAANEQVFECAIGRLFIKGQVEFCGRGKSRRLARRGHG